MTDSPWTKFKPRDPRTGVVPQACPNCHSMMDAATGVTDPIKSPEPGDVSCCLNCGTLCLFDRDLKLIVPDEVTYRVLMTHAEIRRAYNAVNNMVIANRLFDGLKPEEQAAAFVRAQGRRSRDIVGMAMCEAIRHQHIFYHPRLCVFMVTPSGMDYFSTDEHKKLVAAFAQRVPLISMEYLIKEFGEKPPQ
jgi:hypothetical protein